MKLLLWADASPSIGAGHAARVIAIGEQALARGWSVSFSGRLDGAGWLPSRLDELGIPRLPPRASARGFDAVVLDHYEVGDVRDEINEGDAVLVSFEDGLFGRRPADIVVDCGLAQPPRPDDGSPVVLAGVRYAPLRQAVVEARKRRAVDKNERPAPYVLVVLGAGTAPEALVTTLLGELRDTGLPCTVEALVHDGPRRPVALPGQRFTLSPPGPGLLDKLVQADFVVSAAGVTLLELCCIGVPTALVRLVDNQAAGYRAAVDHGLAAGLGTAERLDGLDGSREVLAGLLTDPVGRERMAAVASATVDGRGAARVLDALERVRA